MNRQHRVDCARGEGCVDDARLRSLVDLLASIGARPPVNCPRAVLEGVAACVERLRGQLRDPSSVEQVTTLAMFADALIIHDRLNRALLSRGIARRNGETKQALNDFRQQTRLVLQTLKRLRFKPTPSGQGEAADFRSRWKTECSIGPRGAEGGR